jgi:hypothetical protein
MYQPAGHMNAGRPVQLKTELRKLVRSFFGREEKDKGSMVMSTRGSVRLLRKLKAQSRGPTEMCKVDPRQGLSVRFSDTSDAILLRRSEAPQDKDFRLLPMIHAMTFPYL